MKNVIMKLARIALYSFCLAILFSATVAQAVSISPAKLDLSVAPGDTVNGTIIVGNTINEPQNLIITIKDFIIDPETGQTHYQDDSIDVPRGLKNWISFEETSHAVEANEGYEFNYSINIPEDAVPGGYSTAIIARSSEDSIDPESSGVGMVAGAVGKITLTVKGDFTEEIMVENFEVSEPDFLKGNIVFLTTIKNLGDANTAPTGEITIYDENGDQVEGVYAVMREAYGQLVEAERGDEIPFNPTLNTVLPEQTKVFKTSWENRKIDTGNYTAKLELYYGKDAEVQELSTDFNIVENYNIAEFNVEKYFQGNLPVNFNAKVQNTGSVKLEPTGYLEINNIFGSQKKRVDFTNEELEISGGESKSIDNLVWDNGFAMGFYSATLAIDVGGKTFTKTVSFWVLSWWQIIIAVLVLILIIFGVYKGVTGYVKMKKKLKNLEKKEE